MSAAHPNLGKAEGFLKDGKGGICCSSLGDRRLGLSEYHDFFLFLCTFRDDLTTA
jgi:hypothetical protein